LEIKKRNTLEVSRHGSLVTVSMYSRKTLPFGAAFDVHWELAEVFQELRIDDSVRVIVLTGAAEEFSAPHPSYRGADFKEYRFQSENMWITFTSIVRLHEAMASSEKPIVARVNGNAFGFGSSLVFACDLIVARDDAVIADNHLGAAATPETGPGLVPGDGGTSLIPLYLTPALAKEYLMLGRRWTGAQLAQLGVINYAVPASELDATVDKIVADLLSRPAAALAWTKRLANRHVVEQLARTLDAGVGYEMVNLYQWEKDKWQQSHGLLPA
jgi:enoyl-CoA hydratase